MAQFPKELPNLYANYFYDETCLKFVIVSISEWIEMLDLNNFLIAGVPDTAYYIPNFISEEEEQTILHQVNKTPKSKWVQLSRRRLQNWGGTPYPSVSWKSIINF